MKSLVFIIILSAVGLTKCATLKHRTDILQENSSNENDLLYSEDSNLEERRARLYRTLRNYGVPSDVAHNYVPRLTIGELMGHENNNNSDATKENETSAPFDPWAIVWYIGSFGGLIAFFLVISCSEWCCLRKSTINIISGQISSPQTTISGQFPPENLGEVPICDTPPPAYHLFAPPSYDDSQIFEKKTIDVFVVPVHCGPPKYSDVSKN